MDRRESLKSIVLGSLAGGLALQGCKMDDAELQDAVTQGAERYFGRTPEELELIEKLNAETFFTPHERETLSVLAERILPPVEEYGGPLEAGVPDFMEFMAKDIPELQVTLRGGLMWLDHKSNTEYNLEFKAASQEQQHQIMDGIAFYDAQVPMREHPLEIQFFSLVRNLTVCGYYTSKPGIAELGYKGNVPNIWDGVPQHVLDKHGLAYEEEWLAKCVDQSQRGVIAEWDEDGNLLT
ncbi:gluconate 2-dehydrogenase subunit 3 family protein [Robiginitalea sp. M366]|uniref:gluconate 2-dehydrogenase subunit 3 family protein n=1 Tax=Robiginitalea aestuariiviva TaxID=3036903 RepID=UPI00240D1194|nr:gluconate 2-dehydrogenase subunit 3 family protein [Robiginitalea aestuariiviva]MDG1572685.1 gluconate 2-dehydrogenase subunit 3 family protein [Robiginitalea aestuariiviva]